jgi:hypothetical protein
MFTTKKTVTIVALALAGALSVGAVASAQAQSGSASRSDDRVPATSVSPAPAGDDNGLHSDGAINDDSAAAVTPSMTPAPAGLPTEAEHPQGDDSLGSVGENDGADNESAEGVADDDNVAVDSHPGAGHDVGDQHGGDQGDNSGHDDGSDH